MLELIMLSTKYYCSITIIELLPIDFQIILDLLPTINELINDLITVYLKYKASDTSFGTRQVVDMVV